MRSSWLCAILIGGAALLSLPACSDSSDVGLGVGPDSLEGGEPRTLDVIPTLDTTRTPPITGNNFRQSPTRSTWRFLVGIVDDPIPGTGTVEAQGYVDFAGRSSLPSEIRFAANADSLAAELRLTTDYLHGLEEPMEVQVYDLSQEAEMDSARATASFDADEMEPASVDTAQIRPTDSLVTIRLRQSWINDNLAVLRNTSNNGSSFEDNFPGFKIVAPNSQSVVGFSAANVILRLRHEPDSVNADYQSLKTFTHVERRNVMASPPDDFVLLQDGLGVSLTMDWAYGEEEVGANETSLDSMPVDDSEVLPLNRAEIFVPVDTLAMNDFPGSDFVRPLPKGFRITATRSSAPDTPPCTAVRIPPLSADEDETCALPLVPSAAPRAALASDNVAFPIFQESFRRVRNGQAPIFTTYRVHIADRESASGDSRATIQPGLPSTLPVLVQRPSTPQEEPGPPRATLTVTPL